MQRVTFIIIITREFHDYCKTTIEKIIVFTSVPFCNREEIQEGEDGLLSTVASELQYKAKRRKYEHNMNSCGIVMNCITDIVSIDNRYVIHSSHIWSAM